MDAITLLKNDHRDVEQLFRRFEQAGDDAHAERREAVERIVEELSRHAAIEEQIFYPATRSTVPAVEDDALEALEEHNVVKILLADLSGMDPEHERFVAKAAVLMELVRHHVEEEEQDYFPKVRDELGRKALDELGTAMEALKPNAPTRPHPHLPDAPPANALVAPAAAVVDRVAGLLSGSAQGAYAGLEGLIARVSGAKKPRRAPTGSSTAKRQARKVRRSADDVTDAVERTARRTRTTAKKAAKKATATKAAARTATRKVAKKATAKKATAKKATAKKATAKKATAKRVTAKRVTAKKATAKKAARRT